MRTVLALFLITSLAIAEDKPGDIGTEKDRLQGLWQAVSLEANGTKAPIVEVEKFQLEFKSDKVTFVPKFDNRQHNYDIDPKVEPKAMDFTAGDGEKKGQRLPCAIYDLAGDILVICMDKEGKHGKRPTEFKTTNGDGLALITLERVKQEKPAPAQAQKLAGRLPPTHPDLKYGEHERQVMDLWLAPSDKPTPMLVAIHGGGFRGGNKRVSEPLLAKCLEAGISVAAITYRLTDVAIAPAQHQDCARAVQFLRSKAGEWNLDTKRFAATGESAGAGISMWLALHDDLADPQSEDPVARESTRLTCAAVSEGQTTYDPRVIRDLFPGTDTYQHPALAYLYDVDLARLDDAGPEKIELFQEISAINHLTKDDVPVLLIYSRTMDAPITSQSIGIHHPKFGQLLKQQMDALGIECEIVTEAGDRGDSLVFDWAKKHFQM